MKVWEAVDLCCGLGGWTEGLQAEGYHVVGYDIEEHRYGNESYPGDLVIADILELHGSQFAHVDLLVASPPCQQYSYMAMPWKLAKAKRSKILADETGSERIKLNQIFDACFRIQREASDAAGRHIPMVVENVRGAQEWVGKAQGHFGSYYLWGDVPMPLPKGRPLKVPGFRFDGESKGAFQTASVRRTDIGKGARFTSRDCGVEATGIKQGGDGFNSSQPSISRLTGSKSKARKEASAKIAKIPLVLGRYIAWRYGDFTLQDYDL